MTITSTLDSLYFGIFLQETPIKDAILSKMDSRSRGKQLTGQGIFPGQAAEPELAVRVVFDSAGT
jgi:hypothetical protein